MVRLKVKKVEEGRLLAIEFQFQMVRLKDALNNYCVRHSMSFQFQMVRLKDENQDNTE